MVTNILPYLLLEFAKIIDETVIIGRTASGDMHQPRYSHHPDLIVKYGTINAI